MVDRGRLTFGVAQGLLMSNLTVVTRVKHFGSYYSLGNH